MTQANDRPVSIGEAITQWIEHAYAKTSAEARYHVAQRRARRDHEHVLHIAEQDGIRIVSPDYGPLTR